MEIEIQQNPNKFESHRNVNRNGQIIRITQEIIVKCKAVSLYVAIWYLQIAFSNTHQFSKDAIANLYSYLYRFEY